MKPGFKQTEVGVIPEDWGVQQMGRISSITTGRKDVNEGNPNGEYPFFTCSRVHTFSNSHSFDTEAILIAGNGDVGNLHYYRGPFEAYQRTYVVHNFSVHVRYLWHQLHYRLIESLGLGKIGSSIPYIKKENLTGFSFPLPPTLAEQEAIASALGDADALIESLERLIAKKRDVKQGAMQELLTARRRLPGFTGKWETKRLGEIGVFLKGSGVKKDEAQDGTLPCIRYGEIYTTHEYIVRTFCSWISHSVALTATRLQSGDIVEIAAEQIGNVGGAPSWSWYGFSSRVEWCACFVSWCANEAGYIESGVIPKFSYCPTGVQWFKDAGLWQWHDPLNLIQPQC